MSLLKTNVVKSKKKAKGKRRQEFWSLHSFVNYDCALFLLGKGAIAVS